jgi:hypothetical protein
LVHQAPADGELVEPVGQAEAFRLDGELQRLPLDAGEAGDDVGRGAEGHRGLAEVPVGEDEHHLHGDDQHAERGDEDPLDRREPWPCRCFDQGH